MRRNIVVVAALAMSVAAAGVNAKDKEPGLAADAAASGTVADKSGGLFPNDFGPAEIDVTAYPKEMRQSYRTFAFKCAACHTIARPINSPFLELTAEELTKAKKEDPDLLKDDKIVKAEEGIWKRYIKRMMGKPGCPVKPADGKQIWDFLVYDSKVRKMGANAQAWRAQRGQLLHEFKEHYGELYDRLFPSAK